MMGKRLIKSFGSVEIPRYGGRDFNIPELISYDMDQVEVLANGIHQQISETDYPGRYTVRFVGQSPNTYTRLEFYVREKPEQIVEVKKETAPVPVVPKPVKEEPQKKDKKGFLKALQKKQAERLEVKKQQIREATSLAPGGLSGLRVLTFDQSNCWSRGLGMIQKAKQLEHQIGVPLHRYYTRITGQGDGAIIAAAIAGKISLEKLGEWWANEWRRVHTPSKFEGFARKTMSMFKPNESGFNAKSARKALKKLFSFEGVPMRMKDVGCQLHVTVIQSDLQVSTHQSEKHSDLELWVACCDSAVTKLSYNQSGRLKGEAVFLEFAEKNDVLGMAISRNNDGLQITSIGTPVRVDPLNAKKIGKMGHAADKVAQRDASQFVYNKRVDQVIEKLNINYYLRLECKPIDNIVLNSTTDTALKCGIDSGSGTITLPDWFQTTIRKQIA